jgi:hypothetical protein
MVVVGRSGVWFCQPSVLRPFCLLCVSTLKFRQGSPVFTLQLELSLLGFAGVKLFGASPGLGWLGEVVGRWEAFVCLLLWPLVGPRLGGAFRLLLLALRLELTTWLARSVVVGWGLLGGCGGTFLCLLLFWFSGPCLGGAFLTLCSFTPGVLVFF